MITNISENQKNEYGRKLKKVQPVLKTDIYLKYDYYNDNNHNKYGRKPKRIKNIFTINFL